MAAVRQQAVVDVSARYLSASVESFAPIAFGYDERLMQIFNMLKNQWTSSIIVHCIAFIIYRYSDIICLIIMYVEVKYNEVCRSLQINVRRSSAVREKHLHMDINTSVSCESAICMYTLKTEVLNLTLCGCYIQFNLSSVTKC